jgi:hypothetical protein
MLAAALAVALAVTGFAASPLPSAYAKYAAGPTKILPLQRAFPLDELVELSELRARDRVRHARILLGGGRQSSVGGVVDFPVQGSSDPYLVGSKMTMYVTFAHTLCYWSSNGIYYLLFCDM